MENDSFMKTFSKIGIQMKCTFILPWNKKSPFIKKKSDILIAEISYYQEAYFYGIWYYFWRKICYFFILLIFINLVEKLYKSA